MSGKLIVIVGIVFLLAVGVFSVSRQALLPSEGATPRSIDRFKRSFPKSKMVTDSYQAVNKSNAVRLDGGLGKLAPGGSLPVKVFFNSGGVPIIGVALRISFPYSGSSSDVTASAPVVDQALLSGGGWACPVRSTVATGGKVNIDFACLNTGISGFVASREMPLLTFSLTASPNVAARTLMLTLDPELSVMTRKSDANNILDPKSSLSIEVTN